MILLIKMEAYAYFPKHHQIMIISRIYIILIGSVRPNYTFALGPFALIMKTYFNEHNGYFNLK